MKVTTAMGNAAIQKAVDNGLIPDGVTIEQRQKLDEVLQAALDAHPFLKAASELAIAGSDISRLSEIYAGDADVVNNLGQAMAKVIGAIRFPDGELHFFLYNMCLNACKPKLFSTMQEASDAWDDDQADAYRHIHQPGGEIVEVMDLYGFNDYRVSFFTRADRTKGIITGPLDIEFAMQDPELDSLLMRLEQSEPAISSGA